MSSYLDNKTLFNEILISILVLTLISKIIILMILQPHNSDFKDKNLKITFKKMEK